MKKSLLLCLLTAASLMRGPAASVGTEFTYQGRLTDAGTPAGGEYDLRCILFDAPVGGSQSGPILTNQNIAVTNGVFTTVLDFGTNVFSGQALWLEIAVRGGASEGAFTPLDPRQPLTAVPYALYALTPAGPAGPAGPTGPQGPQGPPGSADAWSRAGNAGTDPLLQFLGTTDNEPFEVRVNGARGWRLIPTAGAASLLAGGSGNHISPAVTGAVIAGGGGNVGSSDTNVVTTSYATIGGGRRNSISGIDGTVAGGNDNDILSASGAAIGGGSSNTISSAAANSVIGGGHLNLLDSGASYGVIGGGWSNGIAVTDLPIAIPMPGATIGGGAQNVIHTYAPYAVIAGGRQNEILPYSTNATIAGGAGNQILPLAPFAFIGGGEKNEVRTNAGWAFIGGGIQNWIWNNSDYTVIAGGSANIIQDAADWSTIGGGSVNRIGPGADYATVPGGFWNEANGIYSFAAGRLAKANHTGAFVWADSVAADFASTGANQFLIRASGGVGIGHNAPDAALHVVGAQGVGLGNNGTVLLGRISSFNMVLDPGSIQTRFNGFASELHLNYGGGNVAIGNTTPAAPLHVVGGTDVGLASGGILVLGAVSAGNVAFDGNEIQARNNDAASTLFLNAGGGNVSIGTVSSTARLRVVNATCDGTTWNNASDRNLKEGFAPVDAQDVLARVAALPISRWNYTNAPGTKHVGPMAQDFQAAFGLGSDDKTIATVDADGVALAAIQGLHALTRAQSGEIAVLKQELAELRAALTGRVTKRAEDHR